MSVTGSYLEREIREQPDALAALLEATRQPVAELARMLRERGRGCVMIAARGSSDNAGRYAQYLLGERLGLPVALAAPSLESLYGARAAPVGAGDVVIGISQSGRSPDVVGVLDAAQSAGTLTVAITNDGGSPLARMADVVLELDVGEERSVAATKTYTSTLSVLAAIVAEVLAEPAGRAAVSRLPALMAETVELAFAGVDALGDAAAAEHVVAISRGYNYATAMEIALKIRELTGTVAEGFSSADLLHGPIAAVSNRTLALTVATGGRAGAAALAAVAAVKERGARSLVVGSAPGAELPLPDAVPEWLTPVLAVVPGQVVALRLAERARVDVDRPAGLTKVTETY